jgi:putative SOS response-associated peptidase YedK
LTTDAAEPVAKLHDRIPVLLEPEVFDLWLDTQERNIELLRGLLQPAAPGALAMYPVSRYVNKAGNEGARCIEPMEREG